MLEFIEQAGDTLYEQRVVFVYVFRRWVRNVRQLDVRPDHHREVHVIIGHEEEIPTNEYTSRNVKFIQPKSDRCWQQVKRPVKEKSPVN